MEHVKRIAAAVMVMLGLCWSYARAGEVDILLQKLVEKGVLSEGEAQQISTETKEEARKEIIQGKNEVLPKWLQTTKFGGDLRIRYQREDQENAMHRERTRIRLRYGLESKPTDNLKIGARLATGENKVNGPEQTSTNASMAKTFNGKEVWVDRAFLEYTPLDNLKLVGGKMANPFWTTDLVWDSDINPEGGALVFTPKIAGIDYFVNLAVFPLEESSSTQDDAVMIGGQIGSALQIGKRPAKIGLAYYDFHNVANKTFGYATASASPYNTVQGALSPNYNPGNRNTTFTSTSSGVNLNALQYDFNVLDIQLSYSPLDVPLLDWTLPLEFYGNFARNMSSEVKKKHSAWLGGLKLGKAKDKGTWEIGWNYREIEQDSVICFLNDSDFLGGGVNSKGHKFNLTYAVLPNSTLGLAFLKTRQLSGTRNINDMLQIDWVTKF